MRGRLASLATFAVNSSAAITCTTGCYGDLAVTFWPVSDILKNGERTTTDFSGRPPYSLGGGLAIYMSEAWALDVNFKAGQGGFKDVPAGDISIGGSAEHVHELLGIEA